MNGSNMHIRVFFDPFSMAEYNASLIGFADLFRQTFPAATSHITRSPAFESVRNSVSAWPNETIDRATIRSMVEDYWRSLLSISPNNFRVRSQITQNFEERMHATASLMGPGKAEMFLQAVTEEREILLDENKRNQDALVRRLGLAPARQPNLVIHHHKRQSMGEMVVRTAVRATIWNAIFSLFRGLR
jgi:hypothetical protein